MLVARDTLSKSDDLIIRAVSGAVWLAVAALALLVSDEQSGIVVLLVGACCVAYAVLSTSGFFRLPGLVVVFIIKRISGGADARR